MTKVFVLPPREDWIVDRLVKEWYQDNSDISTQNIHDCNVVWLLADWCFNQINPEIIKNKKVITTIHHIVPEKWTSESAHEFFFRDKLTTIYHVPNRHTEKLVRTLTDKPISVIPYWANQNIWKKTSDKKDIREKLGIREDEFVIGSFQRDTEGKDLITPKLEKGPDLLADAIIKLNKDKNIHVLLAGWRRQYIISRLKLSNIKMTYIELPTQSILNELYQAVDLYPVTARYEGGPQSLIECGLLNVPVISRDVGIAGEVLENTSINDDILKAHPSVPNVKHLMLPEGFRQYREMIINL